MATILAENSLVYHAHNLSGRLDPYESDQVKAHVHHWVALEDCNTRLAPEQISYFEAVSIDIFTSELNATFPSSVKMNKGSLERLIRGSTNV